MEMVFGTKYAISSLTMIYISPSISFILIIIRKIIKNLDSKRLGNLRLYLKRYLSF